MATTKKTRQFVVSPENLPQLKIELNLVFKEIILSLPPVEALDFTDWLIGQAVQFSGRELLVAGHPQLIPSAN